MLLRQTRSATPSSVSSPTWQQGRSGSNNTLRSGGGAAGGHRGSTTSPRGPRVSVREVSPPEEDPVGASLRLGGPPTSLSQLRGTLWDKLSADQLQHFTESIKCAQRKIYFDHANCLIIFYLNSFLSMSLNLIDPSLAEVAKCLLRGE